MKYHTIFKLFVVIMLLLNLSACSFTTIGKAKVLGIEGDDVAPYRYDTNDGVGGGDYLTYFFETEQSIYHITFRFYHTRSEMDLTGAFVILPLVYFPYYWRYGCKNNKAFDFLIRETTKNPNGVFQNLSVEHFTFYDDETKQSFKPVLVEARDKIYSDRNDIYHLPTKKTYRGADLFENKQHYDNYVEFSSDVITCQMVTPNDKLIIQKPPYIDVEFTFAIQKKTYIEYLPNGLSLFFGSEDVYYLGDIKDKIEPLPEAVPKQDVMTQ